MPKFVHWGLARSGKVKGQTPKVAKKDKKKKPNGRAKRRLQYEHWRTNNTDHLPSKHNMKGDNKPDYRAQITHSSWTPSLCKDPNDWEWFPDIPEEEWSDWERNHYQEKGQQWRRPILATRKGQVEDLEDDLRKLELTNDEGFADFMLENTSQ